MTIEDRDEPATEPTEPTAAPVAAEAAEAPTATATDEVDDKTFAALGLPDDILRAIADAGYATPTPIQAATIPALLEGRDVLGQAQTGTGKTAAFALPLLAMVSPRPERPEAIVLAPTRELALQVAESFETYGRHRGRVRVATVYGGQPYGPQLQALRKRPAVVVGTPGRVLDHLDRGTLDLSGVRWVVLDEADEMLRMGFVEDVERVLDAAPDDRSTVLFSATVPHDILRIARSKMRDPVEVRVAREDLTAETVDQRWLPVNPEERFGALMRVLELEDPDGTLVFVKTRAAASELAHNLTQVGVSAAPLSGDLNQSMREATVERFREGALDVLVATDVAARGLDVERVTLVVNFDVPGDSESYVHRIGRTGRAGRAGRAVLFVQRREIRVLKNIERHTRQRIEQMQWPSSDAINAIRRERFKRAITNAVQNAPLDMYREILADWIEEAGANYEDAAAALAHLAQGGSPLFLPDDPPSRQRRAPKKQSAGDARERQQRHASHAFDDVPRGAGRPERPARPGMAWYLVAVGAKRGVRPGHLVGAIANEAGISSKQIGIVDIRRDHSWVELPEGMPDDTARHLQKVWVRGGQLRIREWVWSDARKGR